MVKKILNIAFWVIFAIVMAIWLIDFFEVNAEHDPKFCIKETVHQFDDGQVKECLGLGYKVYQYDRDSMKGATQFSPFFVKMRKPAN